MTEALLTSPEDILAAKEELELIQAELAKRELKTFVREAWHIVEPDRPFIDNWHIDVLCQELERLTAGTCTREIMNIPPGTMKSLLANVFWPAWMWASNPRLRFLKASYSAHLSIRDNLKMRDIINSPWYQKHYQVKLVSDQNAKTLYKTSEGGWSFSTSVGGAGTGEHPNFVIIDDPITADEARSDVERSKANTWFSGTISSRGVALDVRVLVVMQRLHEEDLSGYLLAAGGWEHICFPMEYEPSRRKTEKDPGHKADKRDPRRKAGALLWEQVFTEAKVRQLKLDLGPYGTAGQLQQRPAPEGGGLFKREWFKFIDVAPVLARRARGWDTASTDGATNPDADWTAGVKMAEAKDIFYVEDVICEQVGPNAQNILIKQTAELDGKKCSQREEREGGASGAIVIDARLKMLKGVDYAGVLVSKDKVTRSKPFRAQCEGGNVYLVRGEWNEKFIRQLCDFPTGKHDDMVDASSCAFNAVLLEPEAMEEWVSW